MISQPHLDLSRRERQIIDILYANGRATAAEVQALLPDPPSYSAVRAMLRILEDKGHVRHLQDGPRYLYMPTRGQRQRQAVGDAPHAADVFRRLCGAGDLGPAGRLLRASVRRRARSSCPPDRSGSPERSITMSLSSVLAAVLNGGDLAARTTAGIPWLQAADAVGKASLLLGAAGLASVALRRASASVRHLIWTLALVGSLVVPALSIALPRWSVPVVTIPAAADAAPAASATLPAVPRHAAREVSAPARAVGLRRRSLNRQRLRPPPALHRADRFDRCSTACGGRWWPWVCGSPAS